jgi:adenine-specific DNA-methyltransferase
MIYIDPPYNTGNDFIYDDNFSISGEEHDLLSGTRDEEGNAMFDEEKWRQNSAASGRFHSEWLSMMYPRLKLARNLLSEDGAIFISIDDGELANLQKLCTEVFGGENAIAVFSWEKRTSRENRRVFSFNHEYIACISRTKSAFETTRNLLPATDEVRSRYRNPDNDPRGPWQSVSMNAQAGHATASQFYEITTPGGRLLSPPSGRCWSVTKEKMQELISDNRIWFGEDGTNVPRRKQFLAESEMGLTPHTLWKADEVGTTEKSKREVMALFDGQELFPTPKPVSLLTRMLEIASKPDSIILDFFSGSATTAHAVMQLNAEDGGKRRHIMVQLPEPCGEKSEAFKAGYKTIAEIGKERIRRAGKKIRIELEEKLAKELKGSEEHTALQSRLDTLDIGFRVLKIDSSNMADVYYQPDELTQDGLMLQVDNLKPGRKPEDLLFQVLLDWGVDLTLPISKEIFKVSKDEGRSMNYEVFFVAENALAACFDTGLDEDFVKELAKRQPLRAVFRDSGYASDAVKINFEQIFKALSPHTELKTL